MGTEVEGLGMGGREQGEGWKERGGGGGRELGWEGCIYEGSSWCASVCVGGGSVGGKK